MIKQPADIWRDILKPCDEHPEFLDITQTGQQNGNTTSDYDAYCRNSWRQVERIIQSGQQDNAEFAAIITWVAHYHFTWLSQNASQFENETLWKTIHDNGSKPQKIFGHGKLPSENHDINWNAVSQDYHHYILSPFAPEMTAKDSNGQARNLLLNYIDSLNPGQLETSTVLDFGAGPGNLIPHLADRVKKLVLLDKSRDSLEAAKAVSKPFHRTKFSFICNDIHDLDESVEKIFDLIISSNSILPNTRYEVVQTFRRLRNLLSEDGKLLAILPSFDTTLYLRDLWKRYYQSVGVSEADLEIISSAFNRSKCLDERRRRYADDGHHIQSYHDIHSIQAEMAAAGLKPVTTPVKLYYPWSLCQKFDYGYFPDAEEEIWDWFVIAERDENTCQ